MRDNLIENVLQEMAKHVGDIYHFSNNQSVEKMVDSGKIYSNTNHISATRNYNLPRDVTKSGGDFDYSKGYNTRLTLDGNKISERHKIKPILGVTANVHDPYNHRHNNHRVSRNEHENEEGISSNSIDFHSKHIKHVHVAPDSIDAIKHYHDVLKPKLDKLGIPSSIGKKFHRTNIREDDTSYKQKLNETLLIEL
jgi:hypothetical protein